MCHYADQTIDGVKLGDWLEDDGQYSRYGIGDEESVWLCTECERLEDNCECEDDHGFPLSRF